MASTIAKMLIAVVGFLVLSIWLASMTPSEVGGDYITSVVVDDSQKIEGAISNLVSDIRKRDFVPVSLTVNRKPIGNCFVVYARGITRENLLKLEP